MIKDFKEWTGPYLQSVKYAFRHDPWKYVYCDEETIDLLNVLFDKLSVLNSMTKEKDEERYDFYFRLPRGEAEQWMSYEDFIEDYTSVKTRKQFHAIFEKWYPRKWYWFTANFIRSKYLGDTYYYIFIGGHCYISIIDGKGERIEDKTYPHKYAVLIKPLLSFADYLVDQVKRPDYASFINKKLDYRLRYGEMKYKEYWKIYPKEKARYFKKYKDVNIKEFIEDVRNNMMSKESATRFERLSANKYCKMFGIASKAVGVPFRKDLSLQENFHRFSDGRNHGLNEIEPDSCDAFDEWYEQEHGYFDHTFEMRAPYHRIDLYVGKDIRGYYLIINGVNFYSTADIVKIYLALKEKGVLAYIYNPQDIIDYYNGDSIYSACSEERYFKTFPRTKIKEYIKAINWDPLVLPRLKN